MNEDADSPVPNITHRYPDRALFLVSPVCACVLPVLHPAAQSGRPRQDPDVAVRERLPLSRAAHRDPGRHHFGRRSAAAFRSPAGSDSQPATRRSRTSRSSGSAAGCPAICPSGSRPSCARCSSSIIRCISTRTSIIPTSSPPQRSTPWACWRMPVSRWAARRSCSKGSTTTLR